MGCLETLPQLIIDPKKAYGLVRRKVVYNVLIHLAFQNYVTYSMLKSTVNSKKVNICLMHFIFRILGNVVFYHQ
jgi:hypothetical protein